MNFLIPCLYWETAGSSWAAAAVTILCPSWLLIGQHCLRLQAWLTNHNTGLLHMKMGSVTREIQNLIKPFMPRLSLKEKLRHFKIFIAFLMLIFLLKWFSIDPKRRPTHPFDATSESKDLDTNWILEFSKLIVWNISILSSLSSYQKALLLKMIKILPWKFILL